VSTRSAISTGSPAASGWSSWLRSWWSPPCWAATSGPATAPAAGSLLGRAACPLWPRSWRSFSARGTHIGRIP